MQIKRPIFYLIAALLPVVLLVLLELTLRIAGYGNSYPLFVPSPNAAGYLQPNPELIQRYFAVGRAPKLSMDTQLIASEKPADSFRIVVQGGSTAAGFPYGRWGSLQAMLTQRFKRSYPEKNIEVINTAMAAINSFSLLDFQADILALQPDLVLIYAGHNEFLGLLGAGSAMTVAGSRNGTLLYLKLRHLRLFQLMQALLNALSPAGSQTNTAQRSLMAQLASSAHIPTDSALYQATLAQFHDNMALLLQGYRQQQIPVMLGTLVSNERDLVPFSAVGLADWPALLLQLPNATTLPALVMQQPAALAFIKGQQALLTGENATAARWLQQARDDDSLRFRAPALFNTMLRTLAADYQATLVDVEQQFRQHSANRIIGNSLLLEHVHPNPHGYMLLADAFYQAIHRSGLLGSASMTLASAIPELDIPLTELDQRYAALKITNLLRQYPFRQPDLPPMAFTVRDTLDTLVQQRLHGTDWLLTQRVLAEYYLTQQDLANASKTMAMLADALPFDAALWQDTGMYYLQQQQLALANYYLYRSLQQGPDNVRFILNMAQLRYMQQRPADSVLLLLRAQQLAPDDPRSQHFIDKVRQSLPGRQHMDKK
jgi:lysophospholipase L1-like esterase